MSNQFQISRDSQALYITTVAKDRLPVFQTDAIKKVTCEALNEARSSGGFLIFAFVIMPDHMHSLTNQPKTSAEVLRYTKGITDIHAEGQLYPYESCAGRISRERN